MFRAAHAVSCDPIIMSHDLHNCNPIAYTLTGPYNANNNYFDLKNCFADNNVVSGGRRTVLLKSDVIINQTCERVVDRI